MTEVAVKVEALTKAYGDGETAFLALRGVDVEIKKGEFLMLVGPSGSGKTTLLSILGAVLKPSSGSYFLFGQNVGGAADGQLTQIRSRQIGFIFQGHNLISSLSARDNVALMLALRGVNRQEAIHEAESILRAVGLGDKCHSLPRDLSGGQKQRVAIARALAGSPPLVLADEPTSALDAENGRSISILMKNLCRERGDTVVVVTHDDRIFDLADRIIRIEDGRIVHGTT